MTYIINFYQKLSQKIRLSNVPFWVKFGISPLFAIAFLLVVSWRTSVVLENQNASTEEIISKNLVAAIELGDIANRLRAANGAVFELTTLQAAGNLDIDYTARLTALSGDVQQIKDELNAFQGIFATEDQSLKIDGIIPALDEFSAAIEFISSMLEIDFSSAVGLLDPIRAKYGDIDRNLNDIIKEQRESAETRGRKIVKDADDALFFFLILVIFAVLFSGLLTVLVGRSTVSSIATIAQTTTRLARGEKDLNLEGLTRKDELGSVVDALSVFRDFIIQSETLQREQREAEQRDREEDRKKVELEQQEAQRHLDEQARIEEEQRAERKILLSELAETFLSKVGTVISEVTDGTRDMRNQIETMKNLSGRGVEMTEDIAVSMDQNNSSIQMVAGGIEELSSSISEITRQVDTSNTIARRATEEAGRTNKTMAELKVTASHISQVIAVINDIAEQTNLLALNATIEAARAGEAGRGFAVVASEVKSLATQTGKATEEIAEQIKSMQSVTEASVDAIGGIGSTIQEMNEIAMDVAASVSEQGAATVEIATSIQTAADSTRTVNSNMSELNQSSRTNGEMATDLFSLAETLNGRAVELSQHVSDFVDGIRVN